MANPIFGQTENITVKNSQPNISPQLRGSTTPEQPAKTVNPVRFQLYKGVSCVTFLKDTGHFGMSGTNYFDVPDESFIEGNLTGIKIAYEVMAAARKGDFDAFCSVHKAAFKVLRDSKGNSETASDGAGAATAYLQTMSEILELAAQKLDLSNLMQDSFFSHEAMMQDTLDDVKAKNIAFMARLDAGNAKQKSGVA